MKRSSKGRSDPEGNQGDAGNKSGIEVSEIIYGLGDQVARPRDKVRIKYQLYNKSGRVEDEKGPLEFILGTHHTYGQGFDDGILGMKIEETRQLKIPPRLCPHNMPTNWRMMVGLRRLLSVGQRKLILKKKETFHVTLLSICESKSQVKDFNPPFACKEEFEGKKMIKEKMERRENWKKNIIIPFI